MKTLRLLRNIAALFILVAALLLSRPGVEFAGTRSCAFRLGFNGCIFSADGSCQDVGKCNPGQPCANFGCTIPHCRTGFC
jgi:hypothetical protein